MITAENQPVGCVPLQDMALKPPSYLTLHRESIMPAISSNVPEERIIFLTMDIDSEIRNTYGTTENQEVD